MVKVVAADVQERNGAKQLLTALGKLRPEKITILKYQAFQQP
jgi:hypothetical protein